MPIQRIMGIETEYGVMDSANPQADLHDASAEVIEAYRQSAPYPGVRWDYSGESPLHDARGFAVAREYADPSLLTDNPDMAAPSGEDSEHTQLAGAGEFVPDQAKTAIQRKVTPTEVVRLTRWEKKFQRGHNIALANGGRLYVDHSHPEYSTPEVTGPTQALLWDYAGERMLAAACAAKAPHMRLFKNNTDGKAVSYGCHENYLFARDVEFDDMVHVLVPFLVTRPLLVGAGRLGRGIEDPKPGFQMSQRADFIDEVIGLHTTVRRPIINTRDEPHTDPEKWRRLHVIIGDANRVASCTWMKLAMTSMVLGVLETKGRAPWQDLELSDPVEATRQVSYDLLGTARLDMADGSTLRPADIQRRYWQVCRDHEIELARTEGREVDAATSRALEMWDELLGVLETSANSEDERLAQLQPISDRVEWVARWQLLSALRSRQNAPWDAPALQAADLQWSEITGKGGLAGALSAAGQIRPVTDFVHGEDVEMALTHPPADTRAWLRGTLIRLMGPAVEAASWHSILIDDEAEYLKRLPLTEVEEWTRELCGEVVEGASSMKDVSAAFAKAPRGHPGKTYGNLWY